MHALYHRLHFVCTDVTTALYLLTRREALPLTGAAINRQLDVYTVKMFTEEQLKKYLENMSPNREFLLFEFSSAEKFIIHMKCDIEKNRPTEFYINYIDKWLKSFSKFTATMWVSQSSYFRKKTLLLQKNFHCQPIDYTKTRDDGANTECKAQIQFKIKVMNGNNDLNVFITIDFLHSHNVFNAPATSFVQTMSDSDKLFFEYFDNGFNATTSKTYHELSLIERYGKRSSQYLADKDINPSIDHIKFLIDKMQSKEIRRSFSDILEAKKAYMNDSGGTLTYTEKPEIVVIITPLMKKVILNNSLECVIVDSSFVKIGLVVTFLYISNKIGALPIACVLHTTAIESNFKDAFNILKITMNTIKKNFNPKKLIINDLGQQKIALSKYFSGSKLISSRWSICSEIWKWLCSEDLKIDYRRRHSLMFLFKSLIHASADTAHAHYTKLLVSDYFDSKIRLRKYIDYLWGRSNEWIVTDDLQLHPLTEVSIRLMKEFLLRKCRFFNIIMMIDVISKLLENHLTTLINTYIDGMPKMLNYTKFFHRSYTARSNEQFMQTRLNEYMIQYQTSPNLYYHVKTDTVCCDCAIGKQGRLCDHLGIILNKGSVRVYKIPILTNIDVDLLVKFIGLSAIKREIIENEEHTDNIEGATNVVDNTVYLNKYQRDCVADGEGDTSEDQSEYDDVKPQFYIIKQIKNNNIRAISKAPDIVELIAADKYMNNDVKPTVMKRKISPIESYMKSLENLNEQLQKLMYNLQNNPNASNIATIEYISKELSKVKPQINVGNVTADVIKYKKRKPND